MFQIEEKDLYCPDCGKNLSPLEARDFCDKCGCQLADSIRLRLDIQLDYPTEITRNRRDRMESILSSKPEFVTFINVSGSEFYHNEEHIQLLLRTILIQLIEFLAGDKNSFSECSKFCLLCGKKLPAFSVISQDMQNKFLRTTEDFMRTLKCKPYVRAHVIKIIKNI